MRQTAAFKAGGFLVLEILIAGLILTSGIAATMYLFRMGFEHLERAKVSNTLSAKLVQATGLIQSLDLEQKKGTEDMGDGVSLQWEAGLLNSVRPISADGKGLSTSLYELFLYQVKFNLSFQGVSRDSSIHVFKYKARATTNETSSGVSP